MSAVFTPVRPGARFGACPERRAQPAMSRGEAFLQGHLAACRSRPGSFRATSRVIAQVRTEAAMLRSCDELDRRRRRGALRTPGGETRADEESAVQVFAHVVVECESLFGVTLHDEQLYAGWAMLHGALVEVATGEGKTLAATLPAITVALTGTPVHVITANDYLAARDGAALRPLYARFGLTLGVATADETRVARADAYRRDVTYCAVKRLVFDYLEDTRGEERDTTTLDERLRSLTSSRQTPTLLRGLCFAVVDEADSILVDEARTPLVLSESVGDERLSRARAAVAIAVARSLHETVDYRLAGEARAVHLTSSGVEAADMQTSRLEGVWALPRYRHELVRQALAALHVFRRDREYLVRDGRVVLIDAASGRGRPDHRLRHGLHQMLEMKEGCEPSSSSEVVASTGLQRFFARYHRVCGTSGTLREARRELTTVYRLPVVRVPAHRPVRLTRYADTVTADPGLRLERLVARVLDCRAAGRPVLVGTRTLALAERVGERFAALGIEHRRLDARQDADEAAVIGSAGEPGAVTVATNMAGRGADIPLHPRARDAGGLHVIVLELNDSARVDRQLFGRASRQGDPGSCERLLCLDDEGLRSDVPVRLVALAARYAVHADARRRLALVPFALARQRIVARQMRQRLDLFHRSEHTLRQLAVSGEQSVYP